MWAVDHPVHGELLMAKHVLDALEYDTTPKKAGTGSPITSLLKTAAVPPEERVVILRSEAMRENIPHSPVLPSRGAIFLIRRGVDLFLMSSRKPKAQEFRNWLSDIRQAIETTGGYLLNEEARETAHADTRTTMPVPAPIAGGYAAVIRVRTTRPRPSPPPSTSPPSSTASAASTPSGS